MKKIKLTNGKTTLVDDKDYNYLNQFKWHSISKNYVARSYNDKEILLHREIMKAKKGFIVDHINGNTMDNQRKNLRLCSHAENIMHRTKLNKNNSSGILGVSKFRNKWRARIMVGKKEIHLGLFVDIKDAKRIRKKAENQFFGEFACLNKIGI